MNPKRFMKRIVALRRFEEEQEEGGLLRQQQLRDGLVRALEAIEREKALARRALHEALAAGERSDAISAEMAMACWPIRQRALEQRLARQESQVELATQSCSEARLRRRQLETALEWSTRAERKRDELRDQKAFDDWAVRNRLPWSDTEDESFQRRDPISTDVDGRDRAGVDVG